MCDVIKKVAPRFLKKFDFIESSVDQLPGDSRSSVHFGQQQMGASDCKKERKYSEKRGIKGLPWPPKQALQYL